VSSRSDTEQPDIAREHAELAKIYVARGLDPDLAQRVAVQLMAKDALAAHTRDELGISEVGSATPCRRRSPRRCRSPWERRCPC